MAKTKLLSVPVNVCGICFAENNDRPDDEIQWLACIMCGTWADAEDDDYTCSSMIIVILFYFFWELMI